MIIMPDLRITSSRLITLLAVWTAVSTALIFTVVMTTGTPVSHAVICMGTGLVVLWIGLCGTAMRLFRDRIRKAVLAIPWPWPVKFVLFATALALIEEAITTTMTNLAPFFGVPVGGAYITASADYLDVVLCHSVIVFVPMFAAWAILLDRYDFHPNLVFLLFGITGTLAEAFSGPQHLAEFGLWIFVYGLMVYLPAYCIPPEREARTPGFRHFVAAIFLPFLFAVPVAAVAGWLHPLRIHFPPLQASFPEIQNVALLAKHTIIHFG